MFSVEVQLELGHIATLRERPTPEGYTHDWTVFVHGVDGAEIQNFVDKVVFNLHESFPKHKRVIREPPYEVSESGYAGFILPIEIYLKHKEEPKKITFEYDLYLRTDDNVTTTRREKLTFQNPGNDFKKKLLKARGVLHEKLATSTTFTAPSQDKSYLHNSKGKSNHGSLESKKSSKLSSNSTASGGTTGGNSGSSSSGTCSVIPSKDKSHHSQHHSSSSSSSSSSLSGAGGGGGGGESTNSGIHEKSSVAPLPSLQNQFTDLFGTPIRAKPSPESTAQKSKDHLSKSSSIGSNHILNSKKSSQVEKSSEHRKSSHEKEKKHKSSKNAKEKSTTISSDSKKEMSKSKVIKNSSSKSSEVKVSQRPTPSPLSSVESLNEKKTKLGATSGSKKRRRSSSSNSSFTNLGSDSKKEKSGSNKTSDKDQEHKKESKRHKSSSKDITTSNNATGNSSSHKAKDVKKESSTSTTISFSNNNNTGTTTLEIKSVMKEKTWDSEIKKTKNKEQKLDETKVKENTSKESTKVKSKDDSKSPKIASAKLLKVPKEKLHTPMREASSSPASILSGSLTPGGATYVGAPSSVSSINCPLNVMNEIEQESLSPLSSGDPVSPLHFEQPRSKDIQFSDGASSSSEDEQPYSRSDHIFENGRSRPNPYGGDDSKQKTNSSKKGTINSVEHVNSTDGPGYFDTAYINELIILQRRISELTDSDILQKIVDTIEDSGLFTMTSTNFDFDLMKLDKSTVKKLKMCLAT